MKPQPFLAEKMAAATRAVRCFEAIRLARLGAPATEDQESDPEASGLIGQEHTLTTTDRGVLEAKLTSVNPNFAAVLVEYYRKAGLEAGDPVAFALTGSFPALNIAALAAAEEVGLRPVAITSVGASMWGANDPAFTWLDMERLLFDRGLLRTRSVAASMGGSNDRGRGLSPKGRALLKDAAQRNDVPLIREPTLEQAVARRVEIYDREAAPGGVKAYVNIGGGAASIGGGQSATLIRPGVSRTLRPYNWAQRGALHHYAKQAVPVIHILDVESIARAYAFPIAPEGVPAVGEGDIFFRPAYDLRIAAPALVLYLILCFGVLRARQRAAVASREVASPAPRTVPGRTADERSGG
jgi:poly-gamma-glutamate system protein